MGELLTPAEAAERSPYSRQTIWRWIRQGKLPARRVPGRGPGFEYRIDSADLDARLAGEPTLPPLPPGDDPLAAHIRRVLTDGRGFPDLTDDQIRLIARLLPRPKRSDDVA
jgi:excisionase family DNA binding protein